MDVLRGCVVTQAAAAASHVEAFVAAVRWGGFLWNALNSPPLPRPPPEADSLRSARLHRLLAADRNRFQAEAGGVTLASL